MDAMELRKYCFFWNRTGNAAQIAASEIGPNCFWNGTEQYTEVKFNDGALVDAVDVNADVESSFTGFNVNAFIIGIWIKTTWSCAAGVPSIAGWLDPWHYRIDANNFITLTFNRVGAVYYHFFRIRVGGVFTDWTVSRGTWSAGDLVHLAWVFDRNGIGGGANTRRFYQDGILERSTNIATANQAATTGGFCLGNFHAGGEPWKGGVDNPKIIVASSITEEMITAFMVNKDYEGFPPNNLAIPTEIKPIRDRKLIVMGIDLYQERRIETLPDVEYSKGFNKTRLTLNQLEIPVINNDGYFSVNNPRSPFSNRRMLGGEVTAYNGQGMLIFSGALAGAPVRNYNNPLKTKLLAMNAYFKERYARAAYSGAAIDPATAFENVCIAYGIDDLLNMPSLERSKAIFQAAGVTINVSCIKSDGLNLMDLLEKIAKYGCAFIYDFLGEIYFQTYESPDTVLISKIVNINDSGILDSVKIQQPDKYLINDYAFNYNGDGGTPLTDAAGDNIGSLSRSDNGTRDVPDAGINNDVVEFANQASAKYIGNSYIRRGHKNLSTHPEALEEVSYSIELEKSGWLTLNNPFKFNFSPEAYVEKTLEPFLLKYSDIERKTRLICYELSS